MPSFVLLNQNTTETYKFQLLLLFRQPLVRLNSKSIPIDLSLMSREK